MEHIQAPAIPVVGQLIRDNPGTISLGQGVVRYGPPGAAVDSIKTFLGSEHPHLYKDATGIPELHDAIRRKLHQDNGIDANPGSGSAVVVTAGSNMGFINALFAITEPGDEIVLLRPYYFNHEMAIGMVWCRVVEVDTDEQHQPDVDESYRVSRRPNSLNQATAAGGCPTDC